MLISHSLEGNLWQFRCASPRYPWRSATVPGCVHRDLLAQGQIPDPFYANNELSLQWIETRDWEYRLRFDVPDEVLKHEHLELVTEGLDTLASLTLNGEELGWSDNMFLCSRWDLTGLLKANRNELIIRFESARRYLETHRLEHKPAVEFNDPIGGATRLRKQASQFGWDWAPRLVTAGIWRGLRLEAWNDARLDEVYVEQKHSKERVQLCVHAFASETLPGCAFRATLSLDGECLTQRVSTNGSVKLDLRKPKLWWPAGQGEQVLYELEVELLSASGAVLDRWRRRVGLRTIELVRSPDAWGESFCLVVNGRPIFAKGANWVPAHSLVAGLRRSDYERDLVAAVQANMNCLRVWGGGVYEDDAFYDLCDELGLLVWQDFMFACTLQPGDPEFVESVSLEVEHQVLRLRHHACLALWCGNNEIAGLNHRFLRKPSLKRIYERVFHKCIPSVLRQLDPSRAYVPSSPWHGDYTEGPEEGTRRGDTHFWDVWHARKPVADYTLRAFRFCSEFGMQSYASSETLKSFCPPEDRNLFGATHENHQKNPDGNRIILDYVARRYGFPRRQEDLVYLSQINQAYCMQVAVEFYRRNRPRCMGALYWQLNDCWPCASWSSIEHSGRWKALHYAARRFFSPLLVSAEIVGSEQQGKGNYRQNTISGFQLHTCSDLPHKVGATLSWTLMTLDGRVLRGASKRVVLVPGEAKRRLSVDLSRDFSVHSNDELVARICLETEDGVVSEEGVLFAEPRFLRLPNAKTKASVERLGTTRYRVRFESSVYQHRFCFDIRGRKFRTMEQYFDLFPGRTKELELELEEPCSLKLLKSALTWSSLVDALS